jgi:hypothetical protein
MLLQNSRWNNGFFVGKHNTKKPASSEAGFLILVARGGIEPPTQGFSILCSTD